jgi:hypothetical protein
MGATPVMAPGSPWRPGSITVRPSLILILNSEFWLLASGFWLLDSEPAPLYLAARVSPCPMGNIPGSEMGNLPPIGISPANPLAAARSVKSETS